MNQIDDNNRSLIVPSKLVRLNKSDKFTVSVPVEKSISNSGFAKIFVNKSQAVRHLFTDKMNVDLGDKDAKHFSFVVDPKTGESKDAFLTSDELYQSNKIIQESRAKAVSKPVVLDRLSKKDVTLDNGQYKVDVAGVGRFYMYKNKADVVENDKDISINFATGKNKFEVYTANGRSQMSIGDIASKHAAFEDRESEAMHNDMQALYEEYKDTYDEFKMDHDVDIYTTSHDKFDFMRDAIKSSPFPWEGIQDVLGDRKDVYFTDAKDLTSDVLISDYNVMRTTNGKFEPSKVYTLRDIDMDNITYNEKGQIVIDVPTVGRMYIPNDDSIGKIKHGDVVDFEFPSGSTRYAVYHGNRGSENFNRSYRTINEIGLMREANETAAKEKAAERDIANERPLPDVPEEQGSTEYSDDMPFN